jgi:hypothetical protein
MFVAAGIPLRRFGVDHRLQIGNRRFARLALVAGMVGLAGLALSAQAGGTSVTGQAAATNAAPLGPVAPEAGEFRADTGWVADWRAERNRLLEADPTLPYDPTSLLVRFRDDADPMTVQMVREMCEVRTIETWSLVPGLEHVAVTHSVPDTMHMLNLIGTAFDAIEFVEYDHFTRLAATPNDSLYSLLWGMNNTGQTVNRDRGTANADIDANLAWDITTGSSSFVVGMADSGILRTHEDLAANIWTNPGEIAGNGIDDDRNGRIDDTWGWDFFNNDNNPTDDNGHGTHTSGTVGAVGNNGRGVTGVAWTVRLAGLKIGSASGSISITAAIGAIDYCVGKGIRVSNHSWGGGAANTALNTAISNARTAGHLIVAAAGNGGFDARGDNNDTLPSYPASYTQDNIIAVAAIDNDNRLATFSNFGAASVDLGAPGVMIASTYNSATNSYVYLDGTSMAAPHVAGAAALVWSRNPTWTYSQVRSRLLSTTKPLSSLSGRTVTGGCLNANNAVR